MGGGGDSGEKSKMGPAAQAHYYINIAEGSRASWSYTSGPKIRLGLFPRAQSNSNHCLSLSLSHTLHADILPLCLSL